jgi:hypothetical protein
MTTVLPVLFNESFYSPGPVACFSDEDDVSGNQNNCYWPLHSESIAGEAGILLHIFGKFMILKLKSSRLSYI